MDIIIAGAGKVGYNLARTLSPVHNVTVIDRNAEALARLQESLDILPVNGDIEDPLTYRKLIDKEADLFIAVTDMDEANLISTLIAGDTIAVKRKFIRLRNEFFAKSSIREKLGIDEAIFPLQLTSETVEQLFAYPRANNVKSFAYADFKLISIRVTALAEAITLEPGENYAVVGIEREKSFIIPEGGGAEIRPGDLVYLFGDESRIRALCPKLEAEAPGNIERCVVFGGGDLGIAIARKLLEHGKEVKIVEENIRQCNIADEALEGEAMTLSCKYGTAELFEEEGLGHADMMIAATGNDEYNIIKCLEAKEHGIRKVVAVNNEMEYYNLMHSLGLVVVRGPKMSAYHTIIERIHSSRVVTERKYCGGRGTIYLRKIFPGSTLIGRRVKPYKHRGESLLYLVRGGQLLPFIEAIELEEGDLLVAFVHEEDAEVLENWLNGL
ncbi:NAD-binding protein [Nitratifractor sp.]|uniref:NAD-binding protein n=1 Tax=Nitratifractor sp. TaxID=2268144 RepID=UPI0025FA97AB|nr:NAD-binding protein [Nitratifractor sp.]